MITATVQSNAAELALQLKGVPAKLRPQLREAMRNVGAYVHRRLVADKLSGASDGLRARTGATKRAVFDRVDGTDDNPRALIGIDLTMAPGARIQNDGGTIIPRNVKSLTIPLDAALTAKGVARFTAHEVIERPEAFGFTGTFVSRGVIFGTTKPKGKGARQQSGPDRPVPLFALKRSVTLPARRFMESSLEASREYIFATVDKAIGTSLGDSHGG